MVSTLRRMAAAVGCMLLPLSGVAAEPVTETLPDVVVTATRSAHAPFDLPASINGIALDGVAVSPAIKTSEFLIHAPGVLARDRQNFAQDEQISIRGFGARASFGVRGVRLYTDGIPASMPDGQGQTSHFNLGAGERLEVLRGPYSALYGNSSGGVIQLFTQDPTEKFSSSISAGAGSYGARALKAAASGTRDQTGYSVQADYFATDGYRDHSEAERLLGNAKLKFPLGEGALTLLVSGLSLPEAADPQGLTRSQLQDNPQQASSAAAPFNTRKTVNQVQGGAIYERPLDAEQRIHLLAYGGRREVTQFLSVPVAVQSNPLHSGGVVDLGSNYGGLDARWNWRVQKPAHPFELTAGVTYERQDQRRRGYENYVGAQTGVQGDLRRDEQDGVYSLDQYVQGEWRLAPQWLLSGGLRHSEVHFSAEDHYVTASNPDDSGNKTYSATTPVAGLLYQPVERWRLYASYGRGFETPTFNELAYRPGGAAGLNFDLPAARSNHFEIGAKHRFERGGSAELALFDAQTRDELAVLSSVGGRTTYQSAGRARRRGVELGLNQPISSEWSAALAYTWLQAQFNASGAAIPGVPRSYAYGDLRWNNTRGWRAGINLQALAPVTVNDAASESAPGYAVLGADAAYSAGRFSVYLRLHNLLDRRYAGSVIVNDANGRYYEPGLPRTFFSGLSCTF